MKQTHLLIACVLLLFFSGMLFRVPLSHAAEGDYVALSPIATGNAETTFTGCSKDELTNRQCLGKYLRALYLLGVAFAGLLVVFSIVRGGFTLLFTDSILGHMEAKGIILRALGGAIIVYSSFLFLNTLNPKLASELDLNLAFTPVEVKAPKGGIVPVELRDEDVALFADRADQKGYNAKRIYTEIEQLEEKVHNDTATAAEETHLQDLYAIRSGSVGLYKVDAYQTRTLNALLGTGTRAKRQEAAAAIQNEMNTFAKAQIAEMQTLGATAAQIAVVRNRVQAANDRIKDCLNLSQKLTTTPSVLQTGCKP